MDAIPVNLVLLRGLLPDLTLTPGTMLTARVLDARTLSVAGVKLAAQMPDGVAAGQVLRLRVAETSTDRIHLRIVETAGQPQAAEQADAPQVPPSAYQLALPGGAVARVHVEEREEGEGGKRGAGQARSVVVRYDSPTLGRLDIRLDASGRARLGRRPRGTGPRGGRSAARRLDRGRRRAGPGHRPPARPDAQCPSLRSRAERQRCAMTSPRPARRRSSPPAPG